MEPILAWGLDVVRAFQAAASPALTAAMRGLSLLGTEWFFLAALPLVYWCVDRRRGARLGFTVFLSSFFNLWLKGILAQPRPYDLDSGVALARESTFGLPSNHAQASVTFWGTVAPLLRRPWGIALAVAMPLLIGLSRVYLGVHFPTDVLAGWALGALFVSLERVFGDRIEAFTDSLRDSLKLGLAAVVALGMNTLDIKNANIAGVFFGFAAGLVYVARLAPFSAGGSAGRRLLRYLVGMVGTMAVYILPRVAAGALGAAEEPGVRFLRYALLGAWASLGAPWLFIATGIAQAEGEGDPPQSLRR